VNRLLIHGDCFDSLANLPSGYVDAIVTDPPYGIRFMGNAWDGQDIEALAETKRRKGTTRPDGLKRHDGLAFAAGTYDKSLTASLSFQLWTEGWAREALRVLKPGGHMLCFSSTRTYHRMACGVEDAGFEVRDQIGWIFGSGFPKSHNVGQGRGTGLKPAQEPAVLARKPLIGTVAENVLCFGPGALNIDGCRIEITDTGGRWGSGTRPGGFGNVGADKGSSEPNGTRHEAGRWPANIIHDGSEEVLAVFPGTKGGGDIHKRSAPKTAGVYGAFAGDDRWSGYGDSGSAARFYYCAKASKAERNAGLDRDPYADHRGRRMPDGSDCFDGKPSAEVKNTHPTVKPIKLMRYLCRLITPPGGVVLDPFMGSGTTGIAAKLEGFQFIGIEREAEYMRIAQARIAASLGEDSACA
jgi:DNA modification methylase